MIIDEKTGIVSRDFRDLYPDGLPEELKKALDPDTLAIMEAEYKHADYAKKNLEILEIHQKPIIQSTIFVYREALIFFHAAIITPANGRKNTANFSRK